ncbi:flagellar basal body P-ring formation chaperone FlgA [Falsiroseomonas ponticola]|uniref:flagellar basal body P-ring formation chaperone FlgA n=1 Tax=Falsiroseomonas ponticola TaxID=2786951 RepID=UPI0019322516|nr:flagellar basal body P-ring formation chaperone FlgA [Roseomonas ponticola]
MRAWSPLLALSLLALPALAQPPAPRAQAVVEAAVVTLGDIFEHAGARADATLGPAPAPGRRFVVEAPQLAAIARDYGLAWRPLAGDERVVVERPGRAMRREEVLEPLRAELVALGADPELDLDIPGFQPPNLPAGAPDARIAVDGALWDGVSRRFSATLVVVAEGMPTFTQRVSGRAVAMRDVVVAARPLRAGEMVMPGDVTVTRQAVDRAAPNAAEDAEAVTGQRLRRAIAAGQTVSAADVAAAPVIARDSVVQLLHQAPGLTLTAQGRALEDGFRGRTLHVLNLASGSVVQAEVLGPGRARAVGAAITLPPAIAARVNRRDQASR